jgi:hypothetical protein
MVYDIKRTGRIAHVEDKRLFNKTERKRKEKERINYSYIIPVKLIMTKKMRRSSWTNINYDE